MRGMRVGQTLEVVPGLLSLTSVRNRGVAFGMFSDLPPEWGPWIFSLISLAAVGVLAGLLATLPHEDRSQRLAVTSVIGGALGNLIDRVRHGEVIDFVDVYWGDWHWPAFNVADSAITIGACLLVLGVFRSPPEA